MLLRDMTSGSTAALAGGSGPGWSFPVWSSDGKHFVYSTTDAAGLDRYEIRRTPVGTTGADGEILHSDHSLYAWSESPDGRFVVYTQLTHDDDLFVVPVAGGTPVPVATGPGNQSLGQFSPDGRWIAYVSNEGGANQVCVRRFPEGGDVRQISTSGGTEPRWRRDGTELFFRTADGALMAVPLRRNAGAAGAPLEYGAVQQLFDGLPTQSTNTNRFGYQPSPDGGRFLVRESVGKPLPITVTLNWQAGLAK